MLWFLRGLRRGVVTTRYPATIDPWTRALPSPPGFHSRLLTRELADRLQDACPARALWREDGVLVVDVGACTGCGRCVEVGGGAVRPSGAFLLATDRRDALRRRVPIAGDDGDG